MQCLSSCSFLLVLLVVQGGCGGSSSGDAPVVNAGSGDTVQANSTDDTSNGRNSSRTTPVTAQTTLTPNSSPAGPTKDPGTSHSEAETAAYMAAAREHPDPTVRLQALETWAQHPTVSIDPLSYALVDPDEQVRARAQELWEQKVKRDVGL